MRNKIEFLYFIFILNRINRAWTVWLLDNAVDFHSFRRNRAIRVDFLPKDDGIIRDFSAQGSEDWHFFWLSSRIQKLADRFLDRFESLERWCFWRFLFGIRTKWRINSRHKFVALSNGRVHDRMATESRFQLRKLFAKENCVKILFGNWLAQLRSR